VALVFIGLQNVSANHNFKILDNQFLIINNERMKIIIYTVPDCQFSKQEKEYLQSKNLPFEEKNLESNREFLTEMLTLSNNFAGTPVTKIEKDDGQSVVLKGFTQSEFDTALGLTPSVAEGAAVTPATEQMSADPMTSQTPVAPMGTPVSTDTLSMGTTPSTDSSMSMGTPSPMDTPLQAAAADMTPPPMDMATPTMPVTDQSAPATDPMAMNTPAMPEPIAAAPAPFQMPDQSIATPTTPVQDTSMTQPQPFEMPSTQPPAATAPAMDPTAQAPAPFQMPEQSQTPAPMGDAPAQNAPQSADPLSSVMSNLQQKANS
jgi:glutaredoxin